MMADWKLKVFLDNWSNALNTITRQSWRLIASYREHQYIIIYSSLCCISAHAWVASAIIIYVAARAGFFWCTASNAYIFILFALTAHTLCTQSWLFWLSMRLSIARALFIYYLHNLSTLSDAHHIYHISMYNFCIKRFALSSSAPVMGVYLGLRENSDACICNFPFYRNGS